MILGSTVIAVRTDREIVIGSDSKVITADRASAGSACKIIQVGNVFFAHTGLAGTPSIGFDVQATAIQAIQSGNSPAERITILAQSVQVPLHQTLVATRRDAPDFYNEFIGEQSAALSMVFGAIEDRTPILSYVEFKPVYHPESDDNLAISYDPGIDLRSNNEHPAFIVIGHKDAIKSRVESQPYIWTSLGIVNAVRTLIQLQIQSTPDVVGPPIAILRIDRQRATWINKPPGCPPVKRY